MRPNLLGQRVGNRVELVRELSLELAHSLALRGERGAGALVQLAERLRCPRSRGRGGRGFRLVVFHARSVQMRSMGRWSAGADRTSVPWGNTVRAARCSRYFSKGI